MNMKCSRVFKKALPLALLSATFAMVACDFGSDSKDSSDEQTVEQKNTVEDGSDQPTKTEPVDGKNVSEQGSSSSERPTDESSSSVPSVTESSSSTPSSVVQLSSSSVVPPSSDSVEPKSSSSLAPCDFENWLGAEGIARINTGYDAGFNNSGYWYLENDSIDGGKSVITWAAEPDPEGGLEPVLEECGSGVCGKYTLDKGVLDYEPFVVIAFDLAGRDADGRAIPVDISGMRGIDIQYSSSHAATLELSLGEEMDKKIGYALPAYDLGKSSTGKYASIPWSKFAQPVWAKGDQIISIDEAITSVASIRVKIQFKTGSEGEFNIMGIGRRGTLLACCTVF
ncbi:hypothetical protein SAMN05720487_11237 [Fibrobacter sp. UWT2]|uniref:hypothetical protein n=1 Tax=Fibrobacter sp. UWT2 TaxID=1896224 RepID=UPI000912CD47|nr:hypothetical protein [Fibrobacter sp. UWT2]SHL35360.1 hypothetical protein SAMN05720487_11237 [Fibrobacter sp. UWT2]